MSASLVEAQPTYYKANYITLDDGISHAEINTFYKDSLGFMWIGTYEGLNRYNSVKIDVFKPEKLMKNNSTGIDLIEAIKEDLNGNLWLGLHGGGIYIYNRKGDKFSSFTDEMVLDTIFRHEVELISALEFDESGNVWFGGNNGLAFYDLSRK